MTTMTDDAPKTEPGRARALLSTADFKLLRTALTAYARTVVDRDELAKINALHHRLGSYTGTDQSPGEESTAVGGPPPPAAVNIFATTMAPPRLTFVR